MCKQAHIAHTQRHTHDSARKQAYMVHAHRRTYNSVCKHTQMAQAHCKKIQARMHTHGRTLAYVHLQGRVLACGMYRGVPWRMACTLNRTQYSQQRSRLPCSAVTNALLHTARQRVEIIRTHAKKVMDGIQSALVEVFSANSCLFGSACIIVAEMDG